MKSSSSSYIRVKLIDSHNEDCTKHMYIMKDSSINDIKSLIRASFHYDDDYKIVGVVDASDDDLIYPFSIFHHHIHILHEKSLHILTGYHNKSIDNVNIMKKDDVISSYHDIMAETAFYIIDANNDDRIDRREMISSLSVALSYLDKIYMHGYDDMDELAAIITESCFTFLGLDESLYISLSDFTAWYHAIGEDRYRDILVRAIQSYHSHIISRSHHPVKNIIHDDDDVDDDDDTSALDQLLSSIDDIKQALGFDHVTIKAIHDSLRADGMISHVPHHEVDGSYHTIIIVTRTHFIARISSLSSVTSKYHHQHQYDVHKLCNMIYNSCHPITSYDHHYHDHVSLHQIISCLSLFYHDNDNHDDMLRQLFMIIADVRNSKIFASDRIVRDFLYQNVKLIYMLSPSLISITSTDAESFAMFIYGQVLKSVRHDHIGLWNSSEFLTACTYGVEIIYMFLDNHDHEIRNEYVPLQLLHSHGHVISSSLASSYPFDVISSDILKHEHIMISLIDAKMVLGLISATPITIFQLFKTQAIDNDGDISITSYHHVLHKLLRHHYTSLSIVDRIVVDYIIQHIFDLFSHLHTDHHTDAHTDDHTGDHYSKHDDDMRCDVLDIIIALISLCGGGPKEKASCIIEAFRFFGDDNMIDDDIKDVTDESPVSMTYVAMCTEPVFVIIAGLNPTLEDRDIIGDISYELTSYAMRSLIKTSSLYDDKGDDKDDDDDDNDKDDDEMMISVEQFEDWFEVLFKLFDNDHGQAVLEAALQAYDTQSSSQDNIILNELKTVISHIYHESQHSATTSGGEDKLSLDFDITEPDTSYDNDNNNDVIVGSNGGALPPSTASIVGEIKTCSELLGLDKFSADDILDILGEYVVGDHISLDHWLDALSYIMRLSNIAPEKYEEASIIANELYNIFRVDDSSSISYIQFTSGLTTLSLSSMEERLTVSYVLHHQGNDDNQGIVYDDFESIVGSHLSVIATCSTLAASKIKESGHSIDIFATAVVSECYAALGLSHDMKLSLEQLCEVGNDCLVLAENSAM